MRSLMRSLPAIVLLVATVGAVTLAPDLAADHPAVWWVVIALAGATVTTIVAAAIRYHRAVRDVWSNR